MNIERCSIWAVVVCWISSLICGTHLKKETNYRLLLMDDFLGTHEFGWESSYCYSTDGFEELWLVISSTKERQLETEVLPSFFLEFSKKWVSINELWRI